MKTPQQQKGAQGENLAVQFLQKKGYEIVVRNYRYKRGEIDIIAKGIHQTLVFVEVKLRSSDAFGLPEEMVSENQQNLIMATAEQYIEESNWQHDIRFDIVAIQLPKGQAPKITHFEDVFY
ncbi:YraN family protein [marine bacterium AO1-C]|nr:YraN family protein [marine bacterium AO1-C]